MKNLKIGVFFVIKKIIIFLILFFLYGTVNAQLTPTIHSTPNGGNWDSSSTWVEGHIPSSNDIVEINGVVSLVGSVNVEGMLITGSGVISKNTKNVYYSLSVNSDVENNGIIGGGAQTYSTRINMYIKGDLINNGEIINIRNIHTYKNIINTQKATCATGVNFYINNDPINNEIKFLSSDNFKPRVFLESDLYITGSLNIYNELLLDNHLMYVDGNQEIFIQNASGGKILSKNGTGDGENIKLSYVGGNIETNIETTEITNGLNGIIGRKIMFAGNLSGESTFDQIIFTGNINMINHTTLNGDVIISNQSTFTKEAKNLYYNLLINGNLENNGILGGGSHTYSARVHMYIRGNLINNGSILYIKNIHTYGDIINSQDSICALGVSLYINNNFQNNQIQFISSDNFKPRVFLESDIKVTGNFKIINEILLENHTIYIDGTQDIYFQNISGGKIISSNGTGDGEKIKIGIVGGNLETNIETTEITNGLSGIIARNIILAGDLSGGSQFQQLIINGTVTLVSHAQLNGDIIINEGGLLTKDIKRVYYSLNINGNLNNDGILGGGDHTYSTRINIYVTGNLNNYGLINHFSTLNLYSNLDNTSGNITGQTFIKWNPIEGYSQYKVSITGYDDIMIQTTQYLLSSELLTGKNIYWNVKGTGLEGDSSRGDFRIINEEFQGPLETPINLKQYYFLPFLDEKQEINLNEKIGINQSGTGVFLSAEINDSSNGKKSLIFELFKNSSQEPTQVIQTPFFTQTGVISQLLPNYGTGSYKWRVKLINEKGNESEFNSFSNNENHYSIYDGFEGYPYSYNFNNNKPDYSLLTGGVHYEYDFDSKNTEVFIENGKKWDLFNNAFDTSEIATNKSKLANYYKLYGLSLDKPNVFLGNCYGMSLSSSMQYLDNNIIKNYYGGFDNLIGEGNIRSNISAPSKGINDIWDIDNDVFDTILSFQLSQKGKENIKAKTNGITNTTEILKTLSQNIDKTYIIMISGIKYFTKTDENGNLQTLKKKFAHSVVPYKVDGNKIYIWDSNYRFNNLDAYNKYIEINPDGSWSSSSYNLDVYSNITLIETNQLNLNGAKSQPGGLLGDDSMISLIGTADLIIEDEIGNTASYINGEIINNIPELEVLQDYNGQFFDISDENFKQIYITNNKTLKIKVLGNKEESYNLMYAGGDFFTEISSVETNLGQIDSYIITKESIGIDFDDNKSGEFSLKIDNYDNQLEGGLYIDKIKSEINPQKFDINWELVNQKTNDSINYGIDINMNGEYEKSIKIPSILEQIEFLNDTGNQDNEEQEEINDNESNNDDEELIDNDNPDDELDDNHDEKNPKNCNNYKNKNGKHNINCNNNNKNKNNNYKLEKQKQIEVKKQVKEKNIIKKTIQINKSNINNSKKR